MAAGYLSLLRDQPNFRRLWLGDLVSFLGDWFSLVALYAAVQAITDSALAVAGVLVVKTLPNFVVAPFVGPIVDRFDRRKLLILADVVRCLCALGLIVAYQAGSLLGLYGFTFTMVCFTGLAFPAKNAVMPTLVPADKLNVANALSGGTWSIMLAIGAALGGTATALFGVSVAFAVDAATYVLSALFYRGLPSLPPTAKKDGDKAGFVDGLRYLASQPYVLALSCLKPLLSLSNGALVLLPIYSVSFPDMTGPHVLGLLYAARGAGAATGSLVLRMVVGDTPRTLRRLIVVGFLTMGGGYWMLGEADRLWIGMVSCFVTAVGTSAVWVFSGTLLQSEADSRFHGRVFAFEFGLMTLVLAASSFLAGSILDTGVAPQSIARGCGLLALVPAILWLTILVTARRRIHQSSLDRLERGYEFAAEEPHDIARSRRFRDLRWMEADDENSESG